MKKKSILYLSHSRFPSNEANLVHVTKMVDSLLGDNYRVSLWIRFMNSDDFIGSVFRRSFVHCTLPLSLLSTSTYRLGRVFDAVKLLVRCVVGDTFDFCISRNFLLGSLVCLAGIPTCFDLHKPWSKLSFRERILISLCMFFRRRMVIACISNRLIELMAQEAPHLSGRLILARDGAPLVSKLDHRINYFGSYGTGKVVGYFGSLRMGRGIEVILDCAEVLDSITFLLFGSSSGAGIEDLARAKRLKNVILGAPVDRDSIPHAMARCDVLLAPYNKETSVAGGSNTASFMSPLKLFEYMASGVPFVSTRLPVIEEFLIHEEHCLLVDYDSSSWVEAIVRILGDASLRHHLTSKSLAEVRTKYGWNKRARLMLESLVCNASSHEQATKEKIRVAFVIGSLDGGGAEQQLTKIINNISTENFELHLFLFHRRGVNLQKIDRSRVKIHTLVDDSPGRISKIFRQAALGGSVIVQMRKILKEEKIKIIYPWLPDSFCLSVISSFGIRDIKIVFARRSQTLYRKRRLLLGLIDKIFVKYADAAICNSTITYQELLNDGMSYEKIFLIRNVPPSLEFKNTKIERVERLNILCLANYRLYKGIDVAIKAISLFNLEYPGKIKYVVYGKDLGSLQSHRELVENLSLTGIVELNEFIHEPKVPWHRYDAYIQSSYEEGFSNSILEALTYGLPVFSSDTSDHCRYVFGKNGGNIFPIGDHEILFLQLENFYLTDKIVRRHTLKRVGGDNVRRVFPTAVESGYLHAEIFNEVI